MGIGVKQDMESAKRWYMRAAGQCEFDFGDVALLTSQHNSINVLCRD